MKFHFVLFSAALSSCAIEEPTFESIRKDGNFEVRKYPTIPIVSAPMENMEKRNDSFRSLFRYIRGANSGNQKIAMTVPVFMENGAKTEKTGRMSFMIPAEVHSKGAPAPNAQGIAISEIHGGSFAVLRFSGWKNEAKREKAKDELAKYVTNSVLKPVGQPFFAYFDPPWKPEILRRNEVWQKVER